MMPVVVLVDREACGDAGLRMRAHLQAIDVKRRRVFFDERRARSQIAKVLGRAFVDLVGMRIGARRQIDLGARDVQKAQRVAVGQRPRLVGAHDVVRNSGHRRGRMGRGTQRCEGKNGSHETV